MLPPRRGRQRGFRRRETLAASSRNRPPPRTSIII
jgi:hypothetical protein